jgi:hypothetical protein
VRGRKKRALPLRRAEEERDAPDCRRRAKAGVRNRRHVKRREGRLRWGRSRTGSRNDYAAVIVHVAENTFATPPSTLEPATTTPSPQRQHHRGHLSLSSLLGSFSMWHRRRWGAPSGVSAWMRAFELQHCRTAIEWRSRAIHAPGPTVAVRGPSEIASIRADLVVAGDVVRRRAASRRAPGYQEAAPGERGEAARAISAAVASTHPACSMLGRRPAEPRGTPPRRDEASG